MARDMRNWMWAEALALLDQAERVHRGTFRSRVKANQEQ